MRQKTNRLPGLCEFVALTPWQIEAGGSSDDLEEREQFQLHIAEQNGLYLTGEKTPIEPYFHPLNRRALDLIPIFFNQATQDHPPFLLVLYDGICFGEATKEESSYIYKAVIKIYAVMHKIDEQRREKESEVCPPHHDGN